MTSVPANEYVYVDTAIGGVNRRNRVRRLSDVDYSPGSERYISHRRATESLVEWVNEHQTVAGFDGATWDSSLPFDFDDRTDPAHALDWTRQFLDKLEREDVPLDALRLYFSGAKGFHVEIPHTLFGGFEPSETLHASEKLAATNLMGGIPFDGAVYDKLRLWRLPNTLNAKSGMYKVRLSLSEVRGLSMVEIKGLAGGPRARMVTAPDEEWMPNDYLVEVWGHALGYQNGATASVSQPEPAWSEQRQNRIYDAVVIAAIAESWPTDPTLSRHSDYLLPLAGFLGRQMNADAVAYLLKEAVLRANDRGFIDDRTRHWEAEVERMAESSVAKNAAGEKTEGLPTIARHWPELADLLSQIFVVATRTSNGTVGPGEKPRGFSLKLASDMVAEPAEETAFLVDGMLPMGGLSLIGAKPKVGKSVLVRNLAWCVAHGEDFLGRACKQGTVVVLCLEEKRAEVNNHLRSMGDLDDVPLYVATNSAPETTKEGLAALREVILAYEPVLLVIDPVFKLVRIRDVSDYAEVNRELEPILILARQTNCHIAVTHHLGKMVREGGDDVLGSTAIFGAIDTLAILRRKNDVRTLHTEQRYGKDLPETTVPLDEFTGRIALGGTVSEMKMEEARKAVLEVLADLSADSEGLDQDAIRNDSGVASQLAYKALQGLYKDDGWLIRSGEGKRNAPYRYRIDEKSLFLVFSYIGKQTKQETRKPESGPERQNGNQPNQEKQENQESILDMRPAMCRACGKELWPDEEVAGVHEGCS